MSGDVKDEEILARFVNLERDGFVDKNNRIRPGALKIDHLLPPSDGWSFCRQDYVANMSERVKQRTKTKGQRYGYASVRALDARQITDDNGKQAFCIVADPIEGDPAHALVKCTGDDYTTEQLRYIRRELLKKFSEVKTGDN